MNNIKKIIIFSYIVLFMISSYAINYTIKEWNNTVTRCALAPENIENEMTKMNIIEKQAFTTDVTKAIMTLPQLKWRIKNMPLAKAAFSNAMKIITNDLSKTKIIVQTPDGNLNNVILVGDLHSTTNTTMSDSFILIRQSDIGTLRVPRSDDIPKNRKQHISWDEPESYVMQVL